VIELLQMAEVGVRWGRGREAIEREISVVEGGSFLTSGIEFLVLMK